MLRGWYTGPSPADKGDYEIHMQRVTRFYWVKLLKLCL